MPGVYLLARFEGEARRRKVAVSSPLIYVGETCEQSLYKRLSQFQRAAFLRKPGHSGGLTFARVYPTESDPAWLNISVMPVELPEPQASAYIRYIERAVLWAYVQRNKAYPQCNSK